MSRTFAQLTEAAVNASQQDERVLYVDPVEYQMLKRSFGDGANWDLEVIRIASTEGLYPPLPEVRVVVR